MSYQATLNAELDKMRANGLSIDGDNAYKRDLLDAVTGALAYGKQRRTPPPAGHWLEPFYEMGIAEADERDAARSLPVGVPAITPAMIEAGANQVVAPIATAGKKAEAVFRAMLAEVTAAPTVKAEQVEPDTLPCEECQGNGELVTDWDRYLRPEPGDVGDEAVAECPKCDGTGRVPEENPSLPAAGSAVEEPTPVMIQAACAAFRMDVSPMQAMQAALRAALSAQQSAPVCWVNDQQLLLCSKSPREVEPGNPMRDGLPRNIAGSALPTEYCNTPLYRGATAAQQSAPERVSVPVELLERVTTWREGDEGDSGRSELRALLASHGRGEA